MTGTTQGPMNSTEILATLIGFDTVSARPNIGLMTWVQGLLQAAGARVVLIRDAGGGKANLYATVGPEGPGVMLSGHTDVVPVEGQAWTVPPFALTAGNGRLYGRGTTDMKGFVACAIAAMIAAARRDLTTPLHLALSHDEEIGCLGVGSLIDMLAASPIRPRICIVGEPTNMQVATGHKGKVALRTTCTGREGHSALALEAHVGRNPAPRAVHPDPQRWQAVAHGQGRQGACEGFERPDEGGRHFPGGWDGLNVEEKRELLRFNDLRGTAVTLLTEAGTTILQLCAITGHSLQSFTRILERYMSMTEALSSAAIHLIPERIGKQLLQTDCKLRNPPRFKPKPKQ